MPNSVGNDAVVAGSEQHDDESATTTTTTTTPASDVMKRLSLRGAAAAAAAESSSSSSNATESTDAADPSHFSLAPFNPSSDQIQKLALEMLSLTSGDVLFDLGCGDGRFLCHAASRIDGLRCVGIEIEALHVSRGNDRIKDAGLESVVDLRLEDATKALGACAGAKAADDGDDAATETATAAASSSALVVEKSDGGAVTGAAVADDVPAKGKGLSDLTLADDATALYLFILPKGIAKMMPILESVKERRLSSGKRFRVLSYMFQVRGWKPTVYDETERGALPVYYYDFGGGVVV